MSNINLGKIKIENDLLNLISKDLVKEKTDLENVLKATIDNSFGDYPQDVVDTGNLKKNSNIEIKHLNKSKKIILKTNLDRVPYAIYPYFGLGTSTKYGSREYLKDTALRWLQKLNN